MPASASSFRATPLRRRRADAASNAASLRAGLDTLARRLGMEIKVRLTEPGRRQRFAILVTRETHCFDALLAAKLAADPALVIGNYGDFAARAKQHRLPFARLNWNDRAAAETRALACWSSMRSTSSCSRGS